MPFSVFVLTSRPQYFAPVEKALTKGNMKLVPKFTTASLFDKSSMKPFIRAGNIDVLIIDIRHIEFGDETDADIRRRGLKTEFIVEPVSLDDIEAFRTQMPDTPILILYDASQREHALKLLDDGQCDFAVTGSPVVHGTYFRTSIASCLQLRERRQLVCRPSAVGDLAGPIFRKQLESALGGFTDGHRMQARDLVLRLKRQGRSLISIDDGALRKSLEAHFDHNLEDLIQVAMARSVDATANPLVPLISYADEPSADDEEHTIIVIQGPGQTKTAAPVAEGVREAMASMQVKPTMLQLRSVQEALSLAETMPVSLMVIDRTASDLDEIVAARNAQIPPAFALLVTSSPLDKQPETRVLSGECDGFWVVVPGQHGNLFARELERVLSLAARTRRVQGKFEIGGNLQSEATQPLEDIVSKASERLNALILKLADQSDLAHDLEAIEHEMKSWWGEEEQQAAMRRWTAQVRAAVAIAVQMVRDYLIALIFGLHMPRAEEDGPKPAIENATILVIDDSRINLKAAKAMLQQSGYEVMVAADGAEGMREAVRSLPTAILLDLHMPGIDGLAVLKKLKGHPRTQRIPVLMLTSESTIEAVQACLGNGASDYVLKPLRKHYLLERLERVFAKHKEMAAQEAAAA